MPQIELNLSKTQFTPKALDYITDYSHRWEFWYGGSGSSKSYSITQKIIIRCCNEKIRVVVCRRYATTIRQTVFALFKEVINKWKLTPYLTIRESDFHIEFPNGSEIIFLGLDNETKLLSLSNISTIFLEEAFEASRDIVEQLNLRMRGDAENQQIIMSWNPISKHHWLYDFVEVNPPANSIKIHSTFKDNPFLNQEYIDAMEDLLVRNPRKAEVFYYGKWGTNPDGLVFTNWTVDEPPQSLDGFELLLGLDWGYTADPTAFIVSYLDKETRTLYVVDEFYKRNMVNREIAEMIKYKGFAKSVIIYDSAEPKSGEEIRREGLIRAKSAVKGKDSINQGISKLQDLRIIVSPSCQNTIMELENYTYKQDKNTGYYTNEPIDDYNHLMDALRYSLQCVDNKHKLQTISKSNLGI